MFRQFAFSFVTISTLGIAAIAPAFAGHGGGGGSGHMGGGFSHIFNGGNGGNGGRTNSQPQNNCLQPTAVDTPNGPVVRWINVCNNN